MAGRFSDIENQADLVNVLISLRMAAIYDIFGQAHLHNFYKDVAAGKADASTLTTTLPEGNISLKEFTDEVDGLGARALLETKRNANRAVTRNFFKESFRITEAYCRISSQLDTLKAKHWFGFARIIANSLSHNFRLEFRPYDLSQLPVSYKGIMIDSSSNGKPVSLQLEILLSLGDELIGFAKGIR